MLAIRKLSMRTAHVKLTHHNASSSKHWKYDTCMQCHLRKSIDLRGSTRTQTSKSPILRTTLLISVASFYPSKKRIELYLILSNVAAISPTVYIQSTDSYHTPRTIFSVMVTESTENSIKSCETTTCVSRYWPPCPIKVNSFAYVFDCTTVGRASD